MDRALRRYLIERDSRDVVGNDIVSKSGLAEIGHSSVARPLTSITVISSVARIALASIYPVVENPMDSAIDVIARLSQPTGITNAISRRGITCPSCLVTLDSVAKVGRPAIVARPTFETVAETCSACTYAEPFVLAAFNPIAEVLFLARGATPPVVAFTDPGPVVALSELSAGDSDTEVFVFTARSVESLLTGTIGKGVYDDAGSATRTVDF